MMNFVEILHDSLPQGACFLIGEATVSDPCKRRVHCEPEVEQYGRAACG